MWQINYRIKKVKIDKAGSMSGSFCKMTHVIKKTYRGKDKKEARFLQYASIYTIYRPR
jgi:hypothetical protein